MEYFNADDTIKALTGNPDNTLNCVEPYVAKSMIFRHGNVTGTLESTLYANNRIETRIRVDVRGPSQDNYEYFYGLREACEFAEKEFTRH